MATTDEYIYTLLYQVAVFFFEGLCLKNEIQKKKEKRKFRKNVDPVFNFVDKLYSFQNFLNRPRTKSFMFIIESSTKIPCI